MLRKRVNQSRRRTVFHTRRRSANKGPEEKPEKVPAGCWPTAILALSMLALFALLGCGIVRDFAEPIDREGCKWDCRQQAGMEFYAYDYNHHACKCKDTDGKIVEIYRLIKE